MYDILKVILPNSQEAVNSWLFTCVLAYTTVSYVVCGIMGRGWNPSLGFWGVRFFNGANLGVCSLLAPSLVVPGMINLLGQASLYLTIAGLVGMAISITQLFGD
ncbi:hypothetical protein [Agrobacterium larrymoorei]|uniref:Uncharacterized protein n=1 Tax=Agrobacterium larrymoorei TaxID=160699 RepID=A0AAF0KDM1_9HYPH|nr:hypothetical protein [Agrobacterium larrymoorei]WHA40077.1 hypothetical protein CFBP5477_009520 [Agrobacterium larrymoorei]